MNFTFQVPISPEYINEFYASLEKFAQLAYASPRKLTPEKLYNTYLKFEKNEYILEQLKKNYEFSEFLYRTFEYFLKNPYSLLSQEYCNSIQSKNQEDNGDPKEG